MSVSATPPSADSLSNPANSIDAIEAHDPADATGSCADAAVMSPEASPWRTQKGNRRPLLALLGLVVGLGCLMGYAALQRYAESNTDPTLRTAANDDPLLPRGTDSKRMADDIIGTPHLGLIPDALAEAPPPAAPAAPTETKVPILSVVDEPPRPPPRPAPVLAVRSQEEDEWHQARVAALREALVAPRTIRFDRQPATTTQGDFVQRELARVAQQRAALETGADPATAYQQAAAQAAQIMGARSPSALPTPQGPGGASNDGASASTNARNDLRAFNQGGPSNRWQLPNQVEDPPSPYMVQVGSVIGAVLDSAVNSELPGALLGHVAQPVYSSTGSHELLIPQGTALFGQYSADVVFGQDRLLVAWQRLRFPNGQTLDIGAMPGTDGVGRSGFEDQVNHHYFRLFSTALLLSMVTTGVTMAQSPSTSGAQDRMSVSGAMSQALGLQFGQVTAQLLQKNLNIAPTIEIRNGFRFNIVVTQDLPFRGPYTER